MFPYVSVLIITYNYEKELYRALEALKRQTFKNFEIVIVDDCSKDNTVPMVNRYINNHKNMHIKLIVHEKNQGIIAARNTALNYAHGKYCYMHDADDWMDDNCLQVLTDVAKKTNADRVVAEFRDVDTSGKVLQIRKLPSKPSKWLYAMHDACLYKRSVITENNIKYEEYSWDDITFNFLFSLKCRKVAYTHKVVSNYYVNPNSASGSSSVGNELDDKRYHGLISLYKEKRRYMSPKDRVFFEYYIIKYYYYSVLHTGRFMEYRQLIKKYDIMHKSMVEDLPNFLENKNIKLFRSNGDRFYGRLLTFGLSKIEKLGLMRMGLKIYSFISKYHYLPV